MAKAPRKSPNLEMSSLPITDLQPLCVVSKAVFKYGKHKRTAVPFFGLQVNLRHLAATLHDFIETWFSG